MKDKLYIHVPWFFYTAPSQPPANLTSSNVTSSSLTFQWTQPLCGSRHGYIEYYSYTLTSEAGTNTGETFMTTIRVDGLRANTEYALAVAAWTAFGMGPYAEKVETTGNNGNL